MQVDLCVAVAEPAIEIKKITAIYELSSLCKDFFRDRNYSTEIECIIIAFLLIRTIPNYEHWYKERKPRYVFDRTTKSPLLGEMITVRKTFSYEIKPSDGLLTKFVMAS